MLADLQLEALGDTDNLAVLRHVLSNMTAQVAAPSDDGSVEDNIEGDVNLGLGQGEAGLACWGPDLECPFPGLDCEVAHR